MEQSPFGLWETFFRCFLGGGGGGVIGALAGGATTAHPQILNSAPRLLLENTQFS